MKDGNVIASGAPTDIVTPAFVRDVFGVDCDVIPDPLSGAPLVLPVGTVTEVREVSEAAV